jgi:hypothetical protein
MCFEVETGNFRALAYSVLFNIGKSVLKMSETLWEDSCVIAKDVLVIHVNFIVIAVAFSGEKMGGISLVLPLVFYDKLSVHVHICVCVCVCVSV